MIARATSPPRALARMRDAHDRSGDDRRPDPLAGDHLRRNMSKLDEQGGEVDAWHHLEEWGDANLSYLQPNGVTIRHMYVAWSPGGDVARHRMTS